jgi:hypothetical protein
MKHFEVVVVVDRNVEERMMVLISEWDRILIDIAMIIYNMKPNSQNFARNITEIKIREISKEKYEEVSRHVIIQNIMEG